MRAERSTVNAKVTALLVALALALFGSMMAGHGAGAATHDQHTLSAALTLDTHETAPTTASATRHHIPTAAAGIAPSADRTGAAHAESCSACLTDGQIHVLTVCGLLVMSAVSLLVLPRWQEAFNQTAQSFSLLSAQPVLAAIGGSSPDLFSLGICRR